MRRRVEKVMARHGTDMVWVHSGGERTVRGFFRAVNTKSWQSIESESTPLGEYSRGQYAYIGPVAAAVGEGDTLRLGEKEYLLRRVEPYWYGQEPVCLWGLCVEKGVNDTWGTRS